MPKKASVKVQNSANSSTPAPAPEAPVEADSAAQAQVKPKRGRKAATASAPTETAPTTEPTQVDSSSPSKRVAPTRESVEQEFDSLVSFIDEEVNRSRDGEKGSGKGSRFLRTVNKRLKALRTHALRISRKHTAVRRNNANSGFSKPVSISKELASFAGWKAGEAKSRVDVTRFICNYIKEKNLQDPKDRRQILVQNDTKLHKLLGNTSRPLTYYTLQKELKPHFSAASVVTPAPAAKKA